jgi:hypothetical protein
MNNIIKNYNNWLLESVDLINEDNVPLSGDGVYLLSASTSAVDLKPATATTIGVVKDQSYTFTIPRLSLFSNISTEGKFNGTISPTGPGTPVPVGKDILTINGKTITDTGSITLTKADFPEGKPLSITASNNGFACLLRLGAAFLSLMKNGGIINSKNYAIKLTMGGNPTDASSRGFSFYYATVGSLKAWSNGLASELAITILNAHGAADKIPNGDANYPILTSIQSQGPEKYFSNRATVCSKSLIRKNLLANETPVVNMANLKTLITGNTGILSGSGAKPRTLSTKGITLAKAVMIDIATAIAPSQMPAGWGQETQAVFTDYANMMRDQLAASDVAKWLVDAQRLHTQVQSNIPPAQTGQSNIQQGEGDFSN